MFRMALFGPRAPERAFANLPQRQCQSDFHTLDRVRSSDFRVTKRPSIVCIVSSLAVLVKLLVLNVVGDVPSTVLAFKVL